MNTTKQDQEIIRFTLKGVEVDRQNISLDFYRQQLKNWQELFEFTLRGTHQEDIKFHIKPFKQGSLIQEIVVNTTSTILSVALLKAFGIIFKVIKAKINTKEEPDFMLGDNLSEEDALAKHLYTNDVVNEKINEVAKVVLSNGIDSLEIALPSDPTLAYAITKNMAEMYFAHSKSKEYLKEEVKGVLPSIEIKQCRLTYSAIKDYKVSGHFMWNYVDERGRVHPLTLHPFIVDTEFQKKYQAGLPHGTVIEADLYVELKHVKKYSVQIARISNVSIV